MTITSGTAPRDDALTVAAIGIAAGCLATVAHEAIGHGGMCLAVGGRITMLSSVYFHCSSGGPLTDVAGPFGNMAAGGAAWLLLRHRHPLGSHGWLLILLLMAINWFWAAGYFVFSGVLDVGDWAFAARDILGRGVWQWRPAAVLLGSHFTR
jgi:hypothetical protein